jgi:5-methylcytosine-specific restriction endonuclease McrA
VSKDNADGWGRQNDPFGEDFYIVPPDEETWARAEQILEDNRDALRHYLELLTWEMIGNSDGLKALISLLWHWKDIDPKWLAEASFMSVSDVRDIAESQSLMVFNCLYCGVELQANNRQHLIQMHQGSEALCGDRTRSQHLLHLLCESCIQQRDQYDEEQHRLDHLRQQALLAEYRERDYADRRRTQEWAILKRQVHRRDGYRCRLCGRDDVQLHVHHRTYETYAEERLEDLITLCRSCHEHFHFLSEAS